MNEVYETQRSHVSPHKGWSPCSDSTHVSSSPGEFVWISIAKVLQHPIVMDVSGKNARRQDRNRAHDFSNWAGLYYMLESPRKDCDGAPYDHVDAAGWGQLYFAWALYTIFEVLSQRCQTSPLYMSDVRQITMRYARTNISCVRSCAMFCNTVELLSNLFQL